MISDGWFEMIFDFCWIWMNFSPGLHHSVCFFDLMMFSNGWHWSTRCDLKKSPPNIVAFHGISWRHLTLEMTPKGLSPKADFFQQNRKKKSTFWAATNSQEHSNSFNSNSTLKFEKNNKGKIPQTKSPFHMDFFVDFGRWTLKPNWPGHCYKKNRDERRAGQASRKTWLGPIVLKNPRLKRSPNQWREIHGFFVGPWGPPVRPGN